MRINHCLSIFGNTRPKLLPRVPVSWYSLNHMTSQGACTRNTSRPFIYEIDSDIMLLRPFRRTISKMEHSNKETSLINRPTHMCIFTLIYKHWLRALSERAECLSEGALANMTTRGSKKAYLAHVWQQLHLPKHKPFRSMHKIVNVPVYFQKCKICPLKMKSKTF